MLKNTLFAIALSCAATVAYAQTSNLSAEQTTAEPILEQVEKAPSFPGGEAAIQKFVAENQRKIQTRLQDVSSPVVTLKVVVEPDGRVSRVRTLSAANTQMEEEAVYLLRKMGRWTPGEQGGKAVRSYVTVPITLQLN